MSDIEIFSDTDIFIIVLTGLSPFFVMLLIGWFFRSLEKRRVAKIFLYLALIYILLIVLTPIVLILLKG